jgi:uncharacterized Zn-binding protein involved in type VI secretion
MGKPAARITDAVAHIKAIAGPIIQGSTNVRIGGLFAARKGDKVIHGKGFETIAKGEPTVRINGKPAARMGDKVDCKGIIVGGCLTVRIGKDEEEDCLIEAAESGDAVVANVGT